MDGSRPASQQQQPRNNPLAALAGAAAAAGDVARRAAASLFLAGGRGGGEEAPASTGVDAWPGGGAARSGSDRHARRRAPAVDWVADRRAATAGASGRGSSVAVHAPPPHEAAKAGLGRATWTLLHTLAAQYPDRPSRRQREDVAKLIDVLTRVYPCGECATHFAAFVRARPPRVGSGADLRGWVCDVHNDVNASLGKPSFNCALVGARWAPLDCEGEGGEVGGACALAPPGRERP